MQLCLTTIRVLLNKYLMRLKCVKEYIKAQVANSEETEKPKVNFEMGEEVKINDGPFQSYTGAVESIDAESGKLKVTIDIFGRSTPVELEYWQVEKQ